MKQNEIHIWSVVATQFEKKTSLEAHVTAEEIIQANRFSNEELRHNWLVSRGCLRKILAAYLYVEPLDIIFYREKEGKPYIKGSPLVFNISHSQHHILVAVSAKGNIGVDCQLINASVEVEAISRDYFSSIEYELIMSLAPSERIEAFYRCWTRKEAFVKATGYGMSLPFSDFSVSVAPDEPSSIQHIKNDIYDLSKWTLKDVDQVGIPAAFAVDVPFTIMKFKEFNSPLLFSKDQMVV